MIETQPDRKADNITDDRAWILREVERGLPSENARLSCALENQAYYDLDALRYVQKRPNESEKDFRDRPKREAGFTQQAIDRLCEHAYNPGPQRKVQAGGLADSLLQQVYEDNHIDAVMAEADRLACLNDVAAIQVEATNNPDKPIDLKIWGAHEFSVFLDPADPRKPVCAVTVDRFNQQTRYRAWFEDVVAEYVTQPYHPERTAGARVAVPNGGPKPHSYGTIPFAFLGYRAPVRQFWTPGPGSFLRRAEERINARLSELDETISKTRPIGVFKNVDPAYNPEIGPGRFMKLPRGGGSYTGEGYAPEGEPSAEYLTTSSNADEGWEDLSRYMRQVSAAVNLPFNAMELDYQDAPSGVSLIIRSAPLLTRSKARRGIYQIAETELARTILTAAGNHYGHPNLVQEASALRLLLSWADPRIPVPGPDRDQADEWEMQAGVKSRVMVVMERFGLSRDQAIEHIAQVADDEAEADVIDPPDEQETGMDGETGEETEGDEPGEAEK